MGQEQRTKPFRVLTIDGGGMRGLYSASYLQRLQASFAVRTHKAELAIGGGFDLIVGTSTGGILACGLSKGISLERIRKLYMDAGPRIFPLKIGIPYLLLNMFVRPLVVKSGNVALREALKEAFGATTIGDIHTMGRRLCLPVVNAETWRAVVLKTPHLEKSNQRDSAMSLVDACLATSAAPVYRSVAEAQINGNFHYYLDGGLWANNPVLVGLVEGLSLADASQPLEIISLGTNAPPEGDFYSSSLFSSVNRGICGWFMKGRIASVGISAQQTAYDVMAMKLAGLINRQAQIRIHRLPSSPIPAPQQKCFVLDQTKKAAMQKMSSIGATDADLAYSGIMHKADLAWIRQLFEDMDELPQQQNA